MAESLYNIQRNSVSANVAWLATLVLPELEDGTPSETLACSTIPLTIDDTDYRAVLCVVPTVSFSSGQAADNASLEIDNSSGYYGDLFGKYDNLFKEIKVTLSECYEVREDEPTGLYVAETVFIGFADDIDAERTDNKISFSFVSDVAQNGILVASRILTQRTCVWRFNKGGLLSADTDPCGWQVAQGGDPEGCDFTRDGLNGCLAHGNEHRMGAVVGLVNASLVTVTNAGIGASGFDYNTGGSGGYDQLPYDAYRYSTRGYNSY